MIPRSILLRLSQFISGCLGLYLLLMAGTFVLQTQWSLATGYGIGSAGAWLIWGVFSFVINRYDPETVREVALVVYPAAAFIAIGLSIFFGIRLESLVDEPRHQSWTVIFAGALLAVVMLIRCLDIRWMRNAADLRHLEEAAHHDEH